MAEAKLRCCFSSINTVNKWLFYYDL